MNTGNFIDLTGSDDEDFEILPLPSKKSAAMAPAPSSSSAPPPAPRHTLGREYMEAAGARQVHGQRLARRDGIDMCS